MKKRFVMSHATGNLFPSPSESAGDGRLAAAKLQDIEAAGLVSILGKGPFVSANGVKPEFINYLLSVRTRTRARTCEHRWGIAGPRSANFLDAWP